jgi:hypothetical protein
MKTEIVKISQVKPNPENPRIIKDNKYKKLVQSIKDFPEMLKVRPIVVNHQMIVLGGNMRLKACKEAGIKEVPIIKTKFTAKKQREFTIKDNSSFGEWDWDMLANEWDLEQLEDWGMDVIKHDWDDLDYIDEEINKPDLKSNNKLIISIPSELIDEIDIIRDKVKEYLSNNFSGCEIQ